MLNALFSRLRPFSSRAVSNEPIHLLLRPEQLLSDRYTILEQLGRGRQATVWLAEDRNVTGSRVAIKVLTDVATYGQGRVSYEKRVMERISRMPTANDDTSHLLHLIDEFTTNGDHGEHLCLVTEVLGSSVLDLQRRNINGKRAIAPLPQQVVKQLARHILRALQTLHEDCSVVHTDIKPDNILLKGVTVKTDPEDYWTDVLATRAVLVDYGSAVPLDLDVKHDHIIQPHALRSPEALVGCPFDVKTDIWNFGCLIFELLTARNLFQPKRVEGCSPLQYHLARIFGMLADDSEMQRLTSFLRTGHFNDHYFDENGNLIFTQEARYRQSLPEILKVYNVYTPELLELLTAMLCIHPVDRPSARELLMMPWFQV